MHTEQRAGLHSGQRPPGGEGIARLAHGSDHVDLVRLAAGIVPHRLDPMIRPIEGGTQKIIHGGIDDHEAARLANLHIDDASHQDAGVADQIAPRLEEQPAVQAAGLVAHHGGVIGGRGRPIPRLGGVAIVDAQSAADVQAINPVAGGAQVRYQPAYPLEGLAERIKVGQLRADMNGDAGQVDGGQGGGGGEDFGHPRPFDAELVLAPARGDLLVGMGVDIRVDADGGARGYAPRLGHGGQGGQLNFGLDIDLHDPGVEGGRHFVVRLADAGKDDFGRRNAGPERPRKLARRHHVGPGAKAGQGADDGDVAVRLDGEADGCRQSGQGLGEGPIAALQHRRGIAIERRADVFGNALKRHRFDVEAAIGAVEFVHP